MVFFSLSFALSLSSTLPLRENNGRKFGPSSSTSMKRKFFLSRAAIIRGGSQHGQTKSGLVLYTSHYQLVSYRVFILSYSKVMQILTPFPETWQEVWPTNIKEIFLSKSDTCGGWAAVTLAKYNKVWGELFWNTSPSEQKRDHKNEFHCNNFFS